MARRVLAAGILVLFAALAPGPVGACGDKLLLPGRGMTFEEAYKAANPGAVVIFAPNVTRTKATEYSKIQALLSRAGHRVSVVQDAGQVARTMAAVKADILLTDLSDAAAVGAQATTLQPSPQILPVLYRATKDETKACKQKYPCDLKADDPPLKFVVAVNVMMNARAKAQKKATHAN